MSTAYTSILKLALPTTGELAGTWGTVVNDNITQMIEQAIAGLATINTWTTNSHTLTVANGTSSESRCAMLVASDGAGLSAAGEIICPAATKLYVLKNGTSYQITLKTASGTGIAVPTGQTAFLFCDGTNVVPCITNITNAAVSSLRVLGSTSGYVGFQAAAAAGSTTYTLPSADGTNGQVLSTNGSGVLSWATGGGVTTFSAGTTGLTPSTATTGAITLAGTLAIANGGTGQTTATAAFNALAPSQTSNSGKYLTTDGTNTSWATVSAGTPAGSDTQVQYNNSGAFGASSAFTWNNSTSTLTVNSINIGRGGGNIATNVFIGTAATGATVNSDKNVGVGVAALNGITNGDSNVAVGWNALNAVGAGSLNVAIGNNTGALLTTGNFNVAVGAFALDGGTGGSSNVAVGYSALTGALSGSDNTAVGASAGAAVTSGTWNTFVGSSAGAAVDSGVSNTAIGRYALSTVTSNNNNVAVGDYAGKNTSGQQNTFLGTQAGNTMTSGDNNTVIGYNAAASTTSVSNEITLGNSSIATLRCQVTSITALSDARDKKDVQNIPLGIDFIQRLRPVSFVWNTRDGAKVNVPEFGFIAQELQSAQRDHGVTLPGLVHDINPDRLEAAPGTLIPVLVKAVQELQAQIDDLKRQLATRG